MPKLLGRAGFRSCLTRHRPKSLILGVKANILRGESNEKEALEGRHHASGYQMRTLLWAIVILCGMFGAIDHAFAQFSFVSVGSTNVGSILDLKISGNYAYLAAEFDGFGIVDVSNPMNPIAAGQVYDGGIGAVGLGVAVSGHYAYLANNNDGLRIYDITRPSNPVNVGHGSSANAVNHLTVSGNYAYMTGYGGLQIYDVSSPANPVMVGQTNNGLSWNVIVSGKFGYVTAGGTPTALRIFDVSNPANPVAVYRSGSGIYIGEALSGNLLYVADEENGTNTTPRLHAFDASDPSSPVEIGVVDLPTH